MGNFFSSPTYILSAVASQFIWYNEYIKIDNDAIYNRYFSQKNLNHIVDLFQNNGKMRSWEGWRAKFDLDAIENFIGYKLSTLILSLTNNT